MGPKLVALGLFISLMSPMTNAPPPPSTATVRAAIPVAVWSTEALLVLLTNEGKKPAIVESPHLTFLGEGQEIEPFSVFQPADWKPVTDCCPRKILQLPRLNFLKPGQSAWFQLLAIPPPGASRFRIQYQTSGITGPVNVDGWFDALPKTNDNRCPRGKLAAEWLGPRSTGWKRVSGKRCQQLPNKTGIYRVKQNNQFLLWSKVGG
jgi:hypothetical protein